MRRVTKSLAVAVGLPLLFFGCATIGPPQPPSLNLPAPPSDLRASRKGDRVTLTWTIPTATTDRETIRTLGPTLVCRASGELNDCQSPVGQLETPLPQGAASSPHKPQVSYSDTLPPQLPADDPSAFATYAVQVLNREHRGADLSNRVKVSLARTLPPPRDFTARVVKEGVALRFTGDSVSIAPADMQYIYRIYRHLEGSNEQVLAAEAPSGPETVFLITDAAIDWGKTYYYHAETVTRILWQGNLRLEIEGDDSPEIKIFADDVFPPSVPSDIQAVFSGPGQKPFIDLVWAPVNDIDLAGYNLYRREEGATPVKLNGELVRAPAYRDENVTSGQKYVYSVSAVDIRGNESARSEETSEAVP